MVAPRMEEWRLRALRPKILRIFVPGTEVIREVASTNFSYQFLFMQFQDFITQNVK